MAAESSLLDLVLKPDLESDSESVVRTANRVYHHPPAMVPAAESPEDLPLLVSLVAYVLPEETMRLPLLEALKPQQKKARPVTRCLWSEGSTAPSAKN